MITAQQLQDVRNDLKQRLDQMAAFDLEGELIRKGQLGELSFEDARPTLEAVLQLVRLIRDLSMGLVPINELKGLNKTLIKTREHLDAIRGFSAIGSSNAAEARTHLINNVETAYAQLYQAMQPIALSNAIAGTSQEDLVGRAKEALNQIDGLKATMSDRLNEAENILIKQRDATADTGVSVHGAHFAGEYELHTKNARKWLTTMWGLLCVSALGGVALLVWPPTLRDSATTFDAIQFTVSKLVVISALLFAIGVAARNYKAHRHNALINKHRQNALQTFESFVKAADNDQQTKNAVLLEATRTIFSNQPTGYMPGAEDGVSPNKIVEIFKTTSSSSGH